MQDSLYCPRCGGKQLSKSDITFTCQSCGYQWRPIETPDSTAKGEDTIESKVLYYLQRGQRLEAVKFLMNDMKLSLQEANKCIEEISMQKKMTYKVRLNTGPNNADLKNFLRYFVVVFSIVVGTGAFIHGQGDALTGVFLVSAGVLCIPRVFPEIERQLNIKVQPSLKGKIVSSLLFAAAYYHFEYLKYHYK